MQIGNIVTYYNVMGGISEGIIWLIDNDVIHVRTKYKMYKISIDSIIKVESSK